MEDIMEWAAKTAGLVLVLFGIFIVAWYLILLALACLGFNVFGWEEGIWSITMIFKGFAFAAVWLVSWALLFVPMMAVA